ncbi:S-methyl-5-thioadenosine phosphorylase [Dimargaris xerosporica]|nr:S-methyl-5-thioadenosine phosphorylase [Dimargaris xerosporica]
MAASHTDVHLAIIGGSGLYKLDGLTVVDEVYRKTPWGYPSDKILIAQTAPSAPKIAFLARHGHQHQHSPTKVPNRANIAALKHLGVNAIIAFSAVGSLREEIRPGDFVLPSQIIDRTKGTRPDTFFDNGILAHASFANPFYAPLGNLVASHVHVLENDCRVHRDKTVVTIEGPAFSTRAESNLYRSWGCDVVNMTAIPEAKLACEAEIAYQMVCMSTDYDCWRESEAPVTVQAVMSVMGRNAVNAKRLIQAVLDTLIDVEKHQEVLQGIKGTMQYAIMTPKHARSAEANAQLRYILPQYCD